MADHISCFEPYTRKDPHHEDQLTRAFVIVLRAVPVAHAAWLALVSEGHARNGGAGVPPLHRLGPAHFEIQRSRPSHAFSRIVSVIQTDDHYFHDSVGKSDRRQILDAVVCYEQQGLEPPLALVVENKPHAEQVWNEQLSFALDDESPPPDPQVASVRWCDILESLAVLLTTNQLSPAERVLVDDFLQFVGEHFSHLQPFTRLSACGTHPGRLRRRCRAILEEIPPSRVDYHQGWAWYLELPCRGATQAGLYPESESDRIVLAIVPGDTSKQARWLYKHLDRERFLALAARWQLKPSLHLAFMSTGLMWPTIPQDSVEFLANYVDYWSGRDIRQIPREQFNQFISQLIGAGMASESDREQFARHFGNTKRGHLNLCPSISCRRTWPRSEAATIDDRSTFVSEVRNNIEELLASWGETLSRPSRGA